MFLILRANSIKSNDIKLQIVFLCTLTTIRQGFKTSCETTSICATRGRHKQETQTDVHVHTQTHTLMKKHTFADICLSHQSAALEYILEVNNSAKCLCGSLTITTCLYVTACNN